jgi:hypothetical protein
MRNLFCSTYLLGLVLNVLPLDFMYLLFEDWDHYCISHLLSIFPALETCLEDLKY